MTLNATEQGVSSVHSVTPVLLPQHQHLLDDSGITSEVALARGYRSVITKAELQRLGFGARQCQVPALLIPVWDVTGEIGLYQSRPDAPRIERAKAVKYETPKGAQMTLDVPPGIRSWLPDPHRPLFITEGVRKADAAASRGLCCIALLGVWNWRGSNDAGGKLALPAWESIALNGRRVYVVFDSDVMTKASVQAALTRLKVFLEHRKAEVWILYLPPGEGGTKVGLDDYFAAGHSVEELLTYASRDLHKSAEMSTEDGRSRVAGYFVNEEGCLARERMTAQGVVVEPLCNFSASVTEELILDNGIETSRVYGVEGKLGTGEALPPIRVPVQEFAAMNWVSEQWGLKTVVCAGTTKRDCLREAIQRLSPTARRRHVFTHTGWCGHEGQSIYLMANGTVGATGLEVDVGRELSRYRLPPLVEDPAKAMRISLQLLRLAPLTITAPLWAGTFRAPLASAYPLDVSLWLEGRTGSLKSTVAALFLSHFGQFERTQLPGSWSSTANQLERRSFLLKDTLFVIDDYAPSPFDARELELKASRLLRAQGNLAGRGRLQADLQERASFFPRGLVLSTGEQHPPGQSILARVILIRLERGQINLALLTEAQQSVFQLPHAMAGYLAWLVPQMPKLPELLRETFAGTRAVLSNDATHLRIPEALCHLWLGLHSGLSYAVEVGACSHEEADGLRSECWDALLTLGRMQGSLVTGEQPVRRFLETVVALLTQRRALLLPKDDAEGNVKPEDNLIGWQDDEWLYLIPEAAFAAVVRFCRDSGEPFSLNRKRLYWELRQDGISEGDAEHQTTTARLGGRTRRILKVNRPEVERLLGEAVPC